MADELLPTIDTIDSVAQPLQSFYSEGSDGKFNLNVAKTDGVELADTRSLLHALEVERADLKKFGGIKPEEVAGLTTKNAELQAEITRIKSHGSKETANAKETDRVHSEQLKETQSKADRYLNHLKQRVLHGGARDALAKAGFGKKADLLAPILASQLEFQEDDKGVRAVVTGKEGQERLIRDGEDVRAMVPFDLAKEFAKDPEYTDLLDGSGASGSGATGIGETPIVPATGVRVIPASDLEATSLSIEDISSGKAVVLG